MRHIRQPVQRHRVILLQAAAPAKPATGTACNGCGVCCATQPCPLGMLVSRRTQGACRALDWDAPTARYRCGVVDSPARWLPWLPGRWAAWLARRWIAAGIGCDAEIEPQAGQPRTGLSATPPGGRSGAAGPPASRG